MTFAALLAEVVARLDAAEVPFMVTGSLASSYHGEPRATLDVDIVIDPSSEGLARLLDGLHGADFYVDSDAARRALDERSQFNAIGPDALKVDFIIRKDRPFSFEEFGRRQAADLLGTPGFVVSAEDLVLAKLEWAAASDSERQIRDAAAIVAIDDALDEGYISRWADVLGVSSAWSEIRHERR